MAATELTVTEYSANAGAVLTWENPDQANGNVFDNSGDVIVLIYNTDAASRTATFTSVADPIYGRTEDLAIVVAQDEVAMAGPFSGEGWNDANNQIALGWSAGTTTTTYVRVVKNLPA